MAFVSARACLIISRHTAPSPPLWAYANAILTCGFLTMVPFSRGISKPMTALREKKRSSQRLRCWTARLVFSIMTPPYIPLMYCSSGGGPSSCDWLKYRVAEYLPRLFCNVTHPSPSKNPQTNLAPQFMPLPLPTDPTTQLSHLLFTFYFLSILGLITNALQATTSSARPTSTWASSRKDSQSRTTRSA